MCRSVGGSVGQSVGGSVGNSFAFQIYKGRLQFPTQWSKGLGGFPEGFPGGFHGFPGVSERDKEKVHSAKHCVLL